jgi:hypothetical protein
VIHEQLDTMFTISYPYQHVQRRVSKPCRAVNRRIVLKGKLERTRISLGTNQMNQCESVFAQRLGPQGNHVDPSVILFGQLDALGFNTLDKRSIGKSFKHATELQRLKVAKRHELCSQLAWHLVKVFNQHTRHRVRQTSCRRTRSCPKVDHRIHHAPKALAATKQQN